MKQIEKELKYQISKDDYGKFKRYLYDNGYLKTDAFSQVNYYIDTEKLCLRDQDITLRIRKVIKDFIKYEITLKTPIANIDKANLIIKGELTLDLEKEVAEDIIANGNFNNSFFNNIICIELGNKCNLAEMKVIGELNTNRELYQIVDDYEPINIDLSRYLNTEDYEIEWETNKIFEARKILLNLLEINEIQFNDKVISKNKRFFKRYLKKL